MYYRKLYVAEVPKEEVGGVLPIVVVPSIWAKEIVEGEICLWLNNIKGGNKGLRQAVENMVDISKFDYVESNIHIKCGSGVLRKYY